MGLQGLCGGWLIGWSALVHPQDLRSGGIYAKGRGNLLIDSNLRARRRSTAVVQRFCKPKVGSSILSAGTSFFKSDYKPSSLAQPIRRVSLWS